MDFAKIVTFIAFSRHGRFLLWRVLFANVLFKKALTAFSVRLLSEYLYGFLVFTWSPGMAYPEDNDQAMQSLLLPLSACGKASEKYELSQSLLLQTAKLHLTSFWIFPLSGTSPLLYCHSTLRQYLLLYTPYTLYCFPRITRKRISWTYSTSILIALSTLFCIRNHVK